MRIQLEFAIIAGLSLVLANQSQANAGVVQATEAMMESQGLQGVLIGQILGPDDASTLNFTSQVDSQGLSFQYSIAGGSTYQGMPVTWVTAGTLDTTSGLWSWTTTSTIGSLNFSGMGGGGPFAGGDPPWFYIPQIDLTAVHEVISDVTYSQTAIRTASQGTFSIVNALGTVLSQSTHFDHLILQGDNAGTWDWDTALVPPAAGQSAYSVHSDGFTPQPDGGDGTIHLQVATVPEPSTLFLCTTACVICACTCRNRRTR